MCLRLRRWGYQESERLNRLKSKYVNRLFIFSQVEYQWLLSRTDF